MKKFITLETPIGTLSVAANESCITDIVFGSSVQDAKSETSPLLENAAVQVNEYFAGTRKTFDLPLNFGGTEFQNRVWRELCNIPYGEVVSYKTLAERTGNVKACRAVGMANNKNRIPIIIPCHRVVGADGKLTGYAGGLDIKRFLLELEQN